ncbi:unnamed protein product [Periconia digitata]|uniref:Uncharacterized protein n=1 Tax=Periconia digitata TaxID=1303443 RepID=A0A9W4XSA7_9PLEO|nr:unnamed protein product [Periconia digitata]
MYPCCTPSDDTIRTRTCIKDVIGGQTLLWSFGGVTSTEFGPHALLDAYFPFCHGIILLVSRQFICSWYLCFTANANIIVTQNAFAQSFRCCIHMSYPRRLTLCNNVTVYHGTIQLGQYMLFTNYHL